MRGRVRMGGRGSEGQGKVGYLSRVTPTRTIDIKVAAILDA